MSRRVWGRARQRPASRFFGLRRASIWFFELLVVVLVMTFAPAVASRILVNAGMVALRNGLLESPRLLLDQFPFYGHLRATQTGAQATSLLDQAVLLDGHDDTTRWASARVAIAAGDANREVLMLQPMVRRIEADPLVYETWLVGLSVTGRASEVQRWYGATGAGWHTGAMSDTLALTYLDTARPFVEMNDRNTAIPFLLQVLRFRPADLYANWCLSRWAEQDGDNRRAANYRRQLEWFPIEAVAPANERLLEYVGEAIPALLEARIWDKEETVRVVSFLVWQAPEAEAVRRLLETLAIRYPSKPIWSDLLGEMDRRRESSRSISQPVLDDRQVPVELLGTAPANPTLGPNLVQQGDFEGHTGGHWQGWAVADYATGRTTAEPSGTFVAGADPLDAMMGGLSARIEGLWVRDVTDPGVFGLVTQDQGRYGSYAIAILPQQTYLISGLYRTRNSSECVLISLGNPQVGLLDERLPATAGVWRRFVLTGCHTDASAQQMQLLLRLCGTGSVWFDDISVRQMDFADRFGPCRRPLTTP